MIYTNHNLKDLKNLHTIKNLCNAFPDLYYEKHKFISQDNEVVFIGNVTGTLTGNFFFVPPTGNISYEAAHIHDGKIIEHRAIRDDLVHCAVRIDF